VCVAAQRVRVIIVNALLLAAGVKICMCVRGGVFFGAQNIHSARVPEARVNIFPATIFNSTPFENFSLQEMKCGCLL
jgi:hypothetical protein